MILSFLLIWFHFLFCSLQQHSVLFQPVFKNVSAEIDKLLLLLTMLKALKTNVLTTFKKKLHKFKISSLFCHFIIIQYFGTLHRSTTLTLTQVTQNFIFSRKSFYTNCLKNCQVTYDL